MSPVIPCKETTLVRYTQSMDGEKWNLNPSTTEVITQGLPQSSDVSLLGGILVVGGIPRFFRRRAATRLSPELSIYVDRLFSKSQPTFTLRNP